MKTEHEKQVFYHDLGVDYFWLAGHYDVVEFILEKYLKLFKDKGGVPKVLDAGCGPGKFISRIENKYSVIGADFSLEALKYSKNENKSPIFVGDLEKLGIRDNSFDCIVSLEVLEHLHRDEKTLREYARVLKPGGIGIITVPAFQFLWGSHDEWFGHVRRYEKKDLLLKLDRANLKSLCCRYFKCVFFLPMWALRKMKSMFHQYDTVKTDYVDIPKWLNKILRSWLFFEVRSNLNALIPFGTHLLCVFQKPELKNG